MATNAKQSFKDYFKEQTKGMSVSGTQYKELRRKWRKKIGYKSPATRVVETGHKLAEQSRKRFAKLLRRK